MTPKMTPREKLRDAGEIVEHILTQPLSIPGLPKNVSLLEAAKTFIDNPASPELKKVLDTFHQHPAALQIMLQEFQLLIDDLS